ncbi:MAG TPA: TfoX/Sxy family protein [Ktedonobacterales bacterium]
MTERALSAEERFQDIVDEFRGTRGVTPPSDGKRFGNSALKVDNKVFAMLSGGRLVLKLPRARVDALVAAGTGERFDPRRDGRVMKEWVTLDPKLADHWLALAQEALDFVGGQ